jgi:molybdenum cofactor cytidylyltransferase
MPDSRGLPARTAAIVPAAGLSRRMGSCKQLLPLGDRPAIARCLEILVSSGLKEIMVVLRPGAGEVMAAVRAFPVTILPNMDPGGDMASSVRVGLRALPPEVTGVFIAPADHPLVTVETYLKLMHLHREAQDSILIPTHEGQKGHPTLFPLILLEELTRLPTLRHVVQAHLDRVLQVAVPDRGVVLDMDTPEDYRDLQREFDLARKL